MDVIEIFDDEGAIIFREHDEEFLIPAVQTEHANRIRSAIAFFLYAAQQKDWVDQFNLHMEQFTEVDEKVENKKKVPHLTIVK